MRVTRETVHGMVVSLLLWGWTAQVLLAVQNVAYMGNTIPIIWYIGILLLADLISNRYVRITLVTVVVLGLLKWEYYPYISWLSPTAFLSQLANDLGTAVHSLLAGDVRTVSDGVRTLAFFGVITFGTKLLQECLAKPLLVLAALVAGEAVLIDAAGAYGVRDHVQIIVFMLIGLALLALTNAPRLQLFSAAQSRRELLRHLAIPTGLAAMIVLTGVAIPKASPNWPKPLALLKQFETASSSRQSSQVYGSNDANLGGPFKGSHKVFLRVFANQPSYYRGESLNQYTGQGWVQPSSATARFASGNSIPASLIAQMGPDAATPATALTQRIQVVRGRYPVLFGAYQIASVTAPGGHAHFTVTPQTDTVSTGAIGPGATYTVTSNVPSPSPAVLETVHDGNLAYAFPGDLQLPQNFPARDVLLAQRITAGLHGTYNKIEAIITYLQSHERYQTSNIPYLKPGQDFVDQFLFVTHRGYCDQFSSALAVLARSINIPSRWVKGFVTVPANPNYHGPGNEYLLRGVDAHSWAEIWFAGYGWIPFEATPSFVLPDGVAKAAQHAPHKTAATAAHKKLAVRKHKGRTARAADSAGATAAEWGAAGAVLSAVLLAAFAASLLRRRRIKTRWPALGMESLMRQFVRRFGDRLPGQTLREYACACRNDTLRRDMLRFVEWFERICYGGRQGSDSVAEGDRLLRALTRSKRMTQKNMGREQHESQNESWVSP
ncbi:MAG: transglutaminase TgpA family protein [Bacilli bacterium]